MPGSEFQHALDTPHGGGGAPRPDRVTPDRLKVFGILWALATITHQATFWDRWLPTGQPLGWLLVGSAVVLLARPGSVWLFAVMVTLSLLNFVQQMPFRANHLFFESVANTTILLAMGWCCCLRWRRARARGESSDASRPVGSTFSDEVFDLFTPVVRVELLVLYGFVVLHKLNTGFLDPEISHNTYLLKTLAEQFPIFPTARWACIASIWSTLAVEAGIPLLLLFKRTRLWGLALGLVFHYLLGLHIATGIYSFSAMLFALFFLFEPERFAVSLGAAWRWVVRGLVDSPGRWWFRAIASLVLIPWMVFLYRRGGQDTLFVAGFNFWLAWGLAVGVVYFHSILAPRVGVVQEPATRPGVPWLLWAMPVLIVFNGMNPYLGLKTDTSFTMFSNLRTEGGETNHLFMPVSWHVAGYQEDVVRLIRSDHHRYRPYIDKNLRITFFEFRRINSSITDDFVVEYTRNGEHRRLERKDGRYNDPEPAKPRPWIMRKLLRFRPIDPDRS